MEASRSVPLHSPRLSTVTTGPPSAENSRNSRIDASRAWRLPARRFVRSHRVPNTRRHSENRHLRVSTPERRAVLATGPPASFQFPGFVSFIGFDQCGEMRGALEPSHGSRKPSGGGGLTQTSRPQKSQRTLSPGWRCVTGRREPGQSRGTGTGPAAYTPRATGTVHGQPCLPSARALPPCASRGVAGRELQPDTARDSWGGVLATSAAIFGPASNTKGGQLSQPTPCFSW